MPPLNPVFAGYRVSKIHCYIDGPNCLYWVFVHSFFSLFFPLNLNKQTCITRVAIVEGDMTWAETNSCLSAVMLIAVYTFVDMAPWVKSRVQDSFYPGECSTRWKWGLPMVHIVRLSMCALLNWCLAPAETPVIVIVVGHVVIGYRVVWICSFKKTGNNVTCWSLKLSHSLYCSWIAVFCVSRNYKLMSH